ncbi:MAG: precorrin-2 dehydrogenase [Miltoncostaeaceae bacterium]|jgi:siroheme synthase-like protein|nr:precorrin-2 dehydrogenase [Miltoncostaeaceae bacterium]
MRYLPVFLDLAGRRCVVLGGDRLAADKARQLFEAGGRVTVFAASPGPEMEELATAAPLALRRRDYRPGDLAGARVAIDASGDEAINALSHEEADRERVLLNVVDVPDRCGFIAPAVVRRDPLLIAISTSGESPWLAGALRARLERLLGEEWGPFVALVGRTRRRLRRAGVPVADQEPVYRRLMASPIRRLLSEGRAAEAELAAEAIAAEERAAAARTR